jgi:copper(I)-binding protein
MEAMNTSTARVRPRTTFITIALALGALITGQAHAAGPIGIENAWTRATAAAQTVGGGFMTIVNTGKAEDRLVSASSPVAAEVQIHDMKMEEGVMRMRQLTGGLAVPAGGRVELKPRSLHLMFMQLKTPLVAGQTVPVTLQFEKAGSVAVQFRVEAMGASAPTTTRPQPAAPKQGSAPQHHH